MTLELFLKALDTISKFIPYLKTFTGERRRDYFDKLLKPLFEAFQDIHEFYNSLFLETRNKCVALMIENTPLLSSEPELSLEALQKLENIKDEFLQLRTKDEALRDSLRQDAKEDLQNIKWLEEQRFLVSLIYYFLGIRGIAPTENTIDYDIRAVIEKGGIPHWETPSTRLYLDIRKSYDLNFIIEKLDESRTDLNQKYMNVRRQFRIVENTILMKT